MHANKHKPSANDAVSCQWLLKPLVLSKCEGCLKGRHSKQDNAAVSDRACCQDCTHSHAALVTLLG